MARQSKTAVVPTLRFPGFEKPWLNAPLSKALVEHKLKNTNGRDVFSVSMESGIVNQVEHLGRSFASSDTAHYNLARRFDVVYTKSPLRAFPFGIVKQCKFDGDVAVSPLYGVFTPENPHVGLMIEAYFESPSRSQAFLAPLCQKGAKNTIQVSNARFLSGRLPLPLEPAEQRLIADCLESLDEVIAAQGRKVEALKTFKCGLMQQLFPRERETLPRLRFPEFRDAAEWADEKLGKFVDIYSGASPSSFTLSSSGTYPLVKVEDLNNCNKYQLTGREYVEDSDGVVPMQAILFPKRGAAIELNKIRVTAAELQIDTNLMAISCKDGLVAEFLFYYLSNVGLAHIADTSTIPQINNKHIVPFSVRIPLPVEQQRIAASLGTFDDLIAAEVGRLDALKDHKKGLMQQLFPSPAET